MKGMVPIVCALFAMMIFSHPAQVLPSPEQPKAQVMILGVVHLEAKHDVHNSIFTDSPLSPSRQSQISDIVARLAKFQPTKVLVEAPYGDAVWAQRFQAYRAGHLTLGPNEVYQFGFRLAAACGNQSIYPIDTFGPDLYDDNSASGMQIDAFLSANFAKTTTPAFNSLLARLKRLQC